MSRPTLAFSLSSSTSNRPVIQRLLSMLTKENLAPLHYAVRSASLPIVKDLLREGAGPNGPPGSACTPLHIAAEHGREEIARELIEAGADVNIAHSSGYTALHWASTGGHEQVVKLLLTNGADVEKVENNGWTAMHLACDKGKEGVVRMFLGGWAPPESTSGENVAPEPNPQQETVSEKGETVKNVVQNQQKLGKQDSLFE